MTTPARNKPGAPKLHRMRSALTALTLGALGVLCATTLMASTAQHGATADLEREAILKVIRTMQDAWNRGDFRGYMQGFSNPDVIFVSGGRFQQGWQGTLDHYIRVYGGSAERRGVLRFHDISVELLAPDAAQLISQFDLVRPEHPQYGINTRLMRKVSGRWVIALNHVSAAESAIAQFTPGVPPQTTH